MPRRKDEESNIRKLTKVGEGQGSLAVTIPVSIVNKLKLRERQKVIVKERGGVITVRDWEQR